VTVLHKILIKGRLEASIDGLKWRRESRWFDDIRSSWNPIIFGSLRRRWIFYFRLFGRRGVNLEVIVSYDQTNGSRSTMAHYIHSLMKSCGRISRSLS